MTQLAPCIILTWQFLKSKIKFRENQNSSEEGQALHPSPTHSPTPVPPALAFLWHSSAFAGAALRWESQQLDDNSPIIAWLHICQGGGQEAVRKQTPPSKELIKATSPDSLLTVAKAGIFQRYCFQKINKDVQEAEVLGDLFNYSPQSCPSNLLTFRPDLANPQQILIYQLKQGPLFYWFTELRKIRHSSEKIMRRTEGERLPLISPSAAHMC